MKKISALAILTIMLLCASIYAKDDALVKRYLYNSNGKKDPFMPLFGLDSGKPIEPPNFNDIRFGGTGIDSYGRKMAIINGELYREGDKTVEGFIVKSVMKNAVVISKGEKEITLEVFEDK